MRIEIGGERRNGLLRSNNDQRNVVVLKGETRRRVSRAREGTLSF